MKWILLMLVLLCLIGTASATDYYVATTGNDAHEGNITHPWLTFSKATSTLTAGDTAYVRSGTYNERLTPGSSGTSGNYITFAAYSGESVTIDGDGLVPNWGGVVHISSKNYIIIDGFNVMNSSWNGIYIVDLGGPRPENVIIKNNFVYDIGYAGIMAERCDNITFDNNTLTNTQTHGHGGPGGGQQNENMVLAEVDYFEIKYNTIYDVANFESLDVKRGSRNGSIHHNNITPDMSCGIYIDAWDDLSYDIDIYDNYVHDGLNAGVRGIAIAAENGGNASDIDIYNNIVENLGANGIIVVWYSTGYVYDINIINNVVYKTDLTSEWAGGIVIQDNAKTSNITVRNNIVSENNVSQISNAIGANTTISHNLIDGYSSTNGTDYILGDPDFVDENNDDFHLQRLSPAIDNGTSTDAPTTDFDGNTRPLGVGYDIGAYEYAIDTLFEYYNGTGWQEGEAYYYLWFTCFWYTAECANAEQSDGQGTLRITNNGTESGSHTKMKLNESAPEGIEIYVDDDNTFAGAIKLNTTYQVVGGALAPSENDTFWAWANLSGASAWEFETYAIVE
jgi:hypothetical protein